MPMSLGLLTFLFILYPGSMPPPQSGLGVGTLRCELIENPLGIDEARPRLSWLLESGERGQLQSAYRILVATSPERLSENRADLWDSGRVRSDATVNVPYAGKTLQSSQEVFWKVCVWDATGRASPWSSGATWTMGILGDKGWNPRTRWITDPGLLRWTRDRIGYCSSDAVDEKTTKWLAIDLGSISPIDRVRLHAIRYGAPELLGFPRRFIVEVSNSSDFREAIVVSDQTAADFPASWSPLIDLPAGRVRARFVRLTATRLRTVNARTCLALRQVEVLSDGKNIAARCAVTANDSIERAPWSASSVADGLDVPGTNPRANDTLLLRRDFEVRAGLRRAVLHITGLGQYELFANGGRVDTGLLVPGWTDYRKTCLYDTHDLTARLHPGANTLGLCLAGGMYNVQEGRYVKFVSQFRPLTAFGELHLYYSDGSVEILGTDESWRVTRGPTTFSNVYGGEDYDARLETAGWNRPGFDDSSWTAAAGTAGPGGNLRGITMASPAFRRFETLKPVAIREPRPGTRVYDFGQNASIMPRLRVRGLPGGVVKIIPAELLYGDGTVDRRSVGGGDAWWSYTLSGRPGGEEWVPSFFYHGSRYLQVELGAPGETRLPDIESLEVSVVHSDSPAAGTFACSNELFNRIRSLVRWAQRSNLAHVISDCPHRERLGWLEQYHLNGPALRYEFDLTRLYAKSFGDMADAQQPDGLIPDIAPEYVVFTDGFRDSPEWGSAFILAAWQHFVWSGDETPLRRYYPAMQRYLAYLSSRSEERIVSYGLGDWFDIGPKSPGVSQLTPISLTATALYYECTRSLERIAAHLGHNEDELKYKNQAFEIKEAFNRRFFRAETGTYASGSQTAQALPLVLGLVEPDRRRQVLEALVEDVRGHGNAITSGDVGYRYLLRALGEGGRSDIIFDMNNQSEKPGYGYQLARGATSLTEAWDASPEDSQNHFMLGQIVEWLYHDLAGIQPDESNPGFKRVILHPSPVGDITWVSASHRSTHGTIRSDWRRDGGSFSYVVDIPPNVTAEVLVPAGEGTIVFEGDRPAERAPNVQFLRRAKGIVAFAIGSGTYYFSVRKQ
jgi:hypothetical protein